MLFNQLFKTKQQIPTDITAAGDTGGFKVTESL